MIQPLRGPIDAEGWAGAPCHFGLSLVAALEPVLSPPIPTIPKLLRMGVPKSPRGVTSVGEEMCVCVATSVEPGMSVAVRGVCAHLGGPAWFCLSPCARAPEAFWFLSPPCPWGQLVGVMNSGLPTGLLSKGGTPGIVSPVSGPPGWL